MEADRQTPPLRTFASLDEDLRRERRVFTTVIVLLVCATLAAAVVAIRTRVLASLRNEEQVALLYDHALADKILDRHSALTATSLLVSLHANGVLPDKLATVSRPCLLGGAGHADPILQTSCDEASDVLSGNGDGPPVQIIRISDATAYLHRPPDDPHTLPHADATLVHRILTRFSAARIDPASAAQDNHVLWFPASSIGLQTNEMIGASIGARGTTPYAIVLTSIDLPEIYAAASPNGREPRPLLLDHEGRLVIGTWSGPDAGPIDARLANRADGVFHWIPSYGWALRRAAPLSGFGHTLYLLPYRQQLATMHSELLLIVAVATTLIVLLLSMYRYWNYRFLGRIYTQAYRALENEMLNHLLVYATPVGLCIVRRDALDVLIANPIARNALGLGPNDTQLPDALRSEFGARGKLDPGPSGEPVISQFAFAMQRAPNDDVHLEITYAPATLDREDVYFCAMTDITEHHRAEQMMLEAKRTTEAAAKAKVAFFASMSHELRTPLSSLVGNIELVARGPLAAEQFERVRAMQSSAEGLLQIVNDVLDFSKIDVGELTLFEEWSSLADLIDRIAMQHVPLAVDNALRFYVVIDRNLPARLRFDPIRVAQIVNNLLSNAFKFTSSGKIVMRVDWTGERVLLSVVDSGIGIPDELRPCLFRPFTQGDVSRLAQARGTGLGLSICARLTRLMKGTIELDSTIGVGTRVSVSLPLQASGTGCQITERALPWRHPALLCRAPEYREWLTGLFDPDASEITTATGTAEPFDPASHDFVIVTDEFAETNVLAWWRAPGKIVWATQAGPLAPVRRRDGGVEVSVYSRSGLRAATQSVVDGTGDAVPRETHAASPTCREPGHARSVRPLAVLIAEDNLLNRNLLRDQLTTLGARVIDATCGEEALALFGRQPVDAVFTDVNMPGISGYDLLDRLRARRPAIPVFAISASALPEDIAEGRARGFTDYLTKPVPLAALARVLETVGASRANKATADGVEQPDVPDVPPAFAQAFLEQTRIDLAELADIVAKRSIPHLRQWLHRVSGGLSVLGASKLLDHCRQLREEAVRAGGWNDDIEQHGLAIGRALEKALEKALEEAMQASMAKQE